MKESQPPCTHLCTHILFLYGMYLMIHSVTTLGSIVPYILSLQQVVQLTSSPYTPIPRLRYWGIINSTIHNPNTILTKERRSNRRIPEILRMITQYVITMNVRIIIQQLTHVIIIKLTPIW